MKHLERYKSTYGLWRVTTEGDVEGRTTRDLGVHEGEIDEIAFALANQSYYALQFTALDKKEYLNREPKAKTVNVSVAIESGTWDLHGDKLVKWWEEFLAKRNVTVLDGKTYAGVELVQGRDNAIVKERAVKKMKQAYDAALSKLTPTERVLLGLKP